MGFARMRRVIPRLMTASLLSVAALGVFSGCSGDDKKKNPTPVTPIGGTPVSLNNFGFSVDVGSGDGDVFVSASGDITVVVDYENNVIDIYDTSDDLNTPPMLGTVDLDTLRMLSTSSEAFLANLDEDGLDTDDDDVYDAPSEDTVSIGAVAIHPSDEYMVVGVNDADDNDDDEVTRSPSRLLWLSLTDMTADDEDGVILPARSVGDILSWTILNEFGADADDATDGDANFFNITGVSFSPDGGNMMVVGDLPDEIDLNADGDTDDAEDVSEDGEFLNDESTICFLGQDGFGFGGGDPLPADAADLREVHFVDGGMTLAAFGVDLGDQDDSNDTDNGMTDHAFVDANAGTNFIGVLGPNDGALTCNAMDIILEDARDESDDLDVGTSDGAGAFDPDRDGVDEAAGWSLSGVIAGSNSEGETVSIENAHGAASATIPQPASFQGGTAVSDGDGLPAEDSEVGYSTDTLYTFIGSVNGDSDFSAVFVVGFGLRGDFQARAATGSASFGSVDFAANGSDELCVVATTPSNNSVMVLPVNLVQGADNFLYGELMDGQAVNVATYLSQSNLGISDVVGFSRQGDLYFAVSCENGDTSNSSIVVFKFDASIETETSGSGSFIVRNPVNVTVDDGDVQGGTTSSDEPGCSSISTGQRDFFAVFNSNLSSVTFIGY